MSTRKRTLIAAAVGFVVLVTGYTAGHAQGVHDGLKVGTCTQEDTCRPDWNGHQWTIVVDPNH